jgi:cardiolipin synthase (CMP-forming)
VLGRPRPAVARSRFLQEVRRGRHQGPELPRPVDHGLEHPEKAPMGLANWLTIVRILLIPVFVTLLTYERVGLALGVFVLAGVTDSLDGYIARTRGRRTRLGAFLDPLADKLLLTVAFVTLTYRYPWLLPFWLTAVVLTRDILLVVVAALIMLTGGHLHPAPTVLGKASTVFQMVSVGVALVGAGGLELAAPGRATLNAATAGLTIASGLQYLVLAPRYVEWEPR